MNSITKDYLTGIVFKKISETIDKYRNPNSSNLTMNLIPAQPMKRYWISS